MPNSENKIGAVELLEIKHLSDGLTLVNFKGKVFEPISPDSV